MCVCHYGGGFASISSSCLSSLEREREGEGGGKEGDEKCCNFAFVMLYGSCVNVPSFLVTAVVGTCTCQ